MIEKTFKKFEHLPYFVSINISVEDILNKEIYAYILKKLEDSGIGHKIVFEIIESEGIENFDKVFEFIVNVKRYGAKISIDDFGTGYSSLNYLKKFRVYKLKIDQSFIRDITDNPEDETIVNTIINMAHSLNMITIAEGVETLEQLDLLRKNGCKEVQGFYFSKPLPAKEFQDFIYALTH